MKKDFIPKSRKDNLVIQELEGEVLVYDLVKNKALCLNQTSALIWQASDGNRTISEITNFVGKQLNSQVNEDIVWLALDQLSKENLIETKAEFTGRFNGLSRRDVIRKAALTSVIALPIITGLVAPLPIHAASNCTTPATACACPNGTGSGQACGQQTCGTNCLCTRTGNCSGGTCAGTCG